jgi:2-dehydro-3-deoxy-D-arabinonate dehydratase
MSSDPILDSGDLAVRSPRPARRWPGRASPFMHLHPAPDHLAAIQGGHCRRLDLTLDEVFSAESPAAFLQEAFDRAPAAVLPPVPGSLVQSQEVWAAGVTYLRSMNARKEESKEAGGDTFYDRVYAADRPELFFKATPHRVAAPRAAVRIRSDSRWNVPEPELTLALDRKGRIFGYTVGNDMSSRDIEGENPLYLPQAKVYDGCAALGPALWVSAHPPGPETEIKLVILRDGTEVFAGVTKIGKIKRPLTSLAGYLFRENSFPRGCYLMTGTGIIPPAEFTLRRGDEIWITIAPIGTLVNHVA